MSPSECSGRTLAFLGDAVWSLTVREDLILRRETRGSQLQRKSVHYVSAYAQAEFYRRLHEEGFFTEEEEDIFRRGSNGHTGTVPAHTDVGTYRFSTGFEALIGALYLEGKRDRIAQIWDKVRTMTAEEV